jgi:hypothetical protein
LNQLKYHNNIFMMSENFFWITEARQEEEELTEELEW